MGRVIEAKPPSSDVVLQSSAEWWLVVMSWMEARRFSFLFPPSLRKYFWAWEATCVGVLVMTNCLEMLLQLPFPNLASPAKKRRCSSSDQATPFFSELAAVLAFFLEPEPEEVVP